MMQLRQRRVWFLIAAAVLLAVIVLQLVPHAGSAHACDWLSILPVFFVGLISPLTLITVAHLNLGLAPDTPSLPSTFQRPPPSRLG